jgi:hypothetical protein
MPLATTTNHIPNTKQPNPPNKTKPNLPPPAPLQLRKPSHQSNSFPTHDTIDTITGGSNANFMNKRQQRDYYHQVNHVVSEGPMIKTKWSHIPITFSAEDINLASFPEIEAMFVMVHIDRWDVTRVLMNNYSQA